jgi:predicted PurR-regulated permease PerM
MFLRCEVDMSAFPSNSSSWLKIGLLLPLIALNAWVVIQTFQYLEPLLTILIGASILAFVLNYPVKFLQAKIDRPYAIAIVLLATLLGFMALGITLVPALLEQLTAIVNQIPDWLNAAIAKLQSIQNWASAHRLPVNLNRVIRQFTERLPNQLEGMGDGTISFTLNAVGGLSSLLLTLVLTFYLLLDGERVWVAIFERLPLQKRDQLRRSLQNDFRNYFIGQAILGVIMAVMMAVVLIALQVPYSLLLAAMVGLMTLVPFGDVLGYGLVCLLIAAQSPLLALTVLGSVIVLDQIIDQAIAPRILGGFTGLKPIWVILALLLGTKLFGFPGLLLAVPIASFINTLLDDDFLLQPEENSSASTTETNPLIDERIQSPTPKLGTESN